MKLLLDTHVWLWSIASPDRIHSDLREVLSRLDTPTFLSAASTWEIVIKYDIGKLPLPEHPRQFIPRRLVRDQITPLSIEPHHTVEVAGIPFHHRDPFDRLLVAQASVENMHLATVDRKLEPYDVDLLWADEPLPA